MRDGNGEEVYRGTCPECKLPDSTFRYSVYAGEDGGFEHQDWRCWEWKKPRPMPDEDSASESFKKHWYGRCGNCGVQKDEHLVGEKCRHVLTDDEIATIKREQVAVAVEQLLSFEVEFCDPKILAEYEANGAEKGAVPPFFSEMFLYETLGKEDARSVLARMRQLMAALADLELVKKRTATRL